MQWKIAVVASSLMALAFTAAIAATFDLHLVQGRTGYSDSFFRKWYSKKPTEGEIIDLAIDTDPFFRGREGSKSKWRQFADKGFLLHFTTSDGRTLVVGPYDPMREGMPYFSSRVVWLTEPSSRLEIPAVWMFAAVWAATCTTCLVFFATLFGIPALWQSSLPGLYLKRRRLEELHRVNELSSQLQGTGSRVLADSASNVKQMSSRPIEAENRSTKSRVRGPIYTYKNIYLLIASIACFVIFVFAIGIVQTIVAG